MTTFTVTTTADSGAGSLREAINSANNNGNAGTVDRIVFATPVNSTIRLTSSALVITQDLIIDGDIDGDNKADVTISGDANNNGGVDSGDLRIFAIGGGVSAGLYSLTLTNAFSIGSGGAINVGGTSTLTMRDSTIMNSKAGDGGAIYVNGGTDSGTASHFVAINSTFTNNTSTDDGGAIYSDQFGSSILINSTIHNNHAMGASSDGGGIYAFNPNSITLHNSTVTANTAGHGGGGVALHSSSSLNAINSVVAENSAGSGGADVFADFPASSTFTATHSFFGTDVSAVLDSGTGNINNGGSPQLGALTDNGGTVQTRSVQAGSPLAGTGIGANANGPDLLVTSAGDSGDDATTGLTLGADYLDGGGLSLREAIFWAAGGETIGFSSTLSGSNITLTAGELVLDKDLKIDGDINNDGQADVTLTAARAPVSCRRATRERTSSSTD